MQNSVCELNEATVDKQISYPCYKSFDEFVDIEWLKSLDGYMTEKIERRVLSASDSLFLNQHRLETASPYQPGVREIWLANTKPGVPYDYFDLDKPELWQRTAEADEFSELMDFIETLPFKETGRILVMYDVDANPVPAHRDHLNPDVCHEFLWFRTNLKKPFYMLNHETNEKLYVNTYTAWFDSVNQFHGSDSCPGLAFSIRVDGKFTDEFRKQIPVPDSNSASTPALWCSV